MENSFPFIPLWKRGMKGDLTAFQKAKRLPYIENRLLKGGMKNESAGHLNGRTALRDPCELP
jgi:hypothetical protein